MSWSRRLLLLVVEIGPVELRMHWVAVVNRSGAEENTEVFEEALWFWLGMKDLSFN